MILNSIFLHLDGRYFSSEICLKLKDQSRHITYRIQRALKEEKFSTDGFNRIVIEPSEKATNEIFINSSSVANISVDFDIEKFNKLTDEELENYYISMIKNGLKNFNEKIQIPVCSMLNTIDDLEKNDFIDFWIYKEKQSKKLKLSAKLICKMDRKEFTLSLVIEKNESTIFNKDILKTPPDEISFHYKFKDLIINENFVEVTARIPQDEILARVPIS